MKAHQPVNTYTDKTKTYLNDIISKRIASHPDIQLQAKLCKADMKESPIMYYDPRYAEHICSWIEKFIKHYDKAYRGQPFILSPFQVAILCLTYGFRDKSTIPGAPNKRYYEKVMMMAGRKTGKTMFCAAILAYHTAFCKPHEQYFTIATGHSQATILWRMAMHLIRPLTILGPKVRFQPHISTFTHRNQTKCIALSKNIDKQDGLSCDLGFFDECANILDQNTFDVIETSMGVAPEPLGYYITTAGNDKDCVFATRFNIALDELKDKKKDNRTLIFNYRIGKGDDPFKKEHWIKANPNIGVTTTYDRMQIWANAAKVDQGRLVSFLQKHQNEYTDDHLKWVAIDALWDNRISKAKMDAIIKEKNLPMSLGVDMGLNDDFTALIRNYYDAETDTYYITHKNYLPLTSLNKIAQKFHAMIYQAVKDGYFEFVKQTIISQKFILNEINALNAVEPIKEVLIDPFYSAEVVTGLTLPVVKVPQTMVKLSPTIARFEEQVALGRIRIVDDPFFFWQIKNVVVFLGANDMRKLLAKGKSQTNKTSEKIDSVAAMLNTFYTDYFLGGARPVRKIQSFAL